MTYWMLAHLVATTALAGIGWVVQAVVYPAFALVGAAEWPAYHRRHTRAITPVVGLPWVVQAVTLVGLAVVDLSPVVTALGVLALAGVALTVFAAVPAHSRLAAGADPAQLRRLLGANLLRSLVWSASALVSALALIPGGLPCTP
jgi:hypothetical protein